MFTPKVVGSFRVDHTDKRGSVGGVERTGNILFYQVASLYA